MVMMMMMMMRRKAVLVGCVWMSVWPAWCVCFSRGAGSSSCKEMKPGHISSQPPHTHSATSIHTSRSVYLPQHTLVVSVRSSRAFMGFLLQARSVPEDHVVGGEFMLHPPGTHTLSCVSTADTVTHSDKLLKRNLSFTWRAPALPSGDLRFYITVVHSYFVYWSRIRSAVVHDGTSRSHRDPSYDDNLKIKTTSASLMKATDTFSDKNVLNNSQSLDMYTYAPPIHTSPLDTHETHSNVTQDRLYNTTLQPCTLTHKVTHTSPAPTNTGVFQSHTLIHSHTSSDKCTSMHTLMHIEPLKHMHTDHLKLPVDTHTYKTMLNTQTQRSVPVTSHIHILHTLAKKRLIATSSHTLTALTTHTHTHRWSIASILETSTYQHRKDITVPSTPVQTNLQPSPSLQMLSPISQSYSILFPIQTIRPVSASTPVPTPISFSTSTQIQVLNQTTNLKLILLPTKTLIPVSLPPESLNSALSSNSIPVPASNLISTTTTPISNVILTPTSTSNPVPASISHLTLTPMSTPVPTPTSNPVSIRTTNTNLSLSPTLGSILIPTTMSNLTSTPTPTLRLPLTPVSTLILTPISTSIPTQTSNINETFIQTPLSNIIPIPTTTQTSILNLMLKLRSTTTKMSPSNSPLVIAPMQVPTSTPFSTLQTHMATYTPLHITTLPSSSHPDQSPAIQRSLAKPLSAREFLDDQTQKEEDSSDLNFRPIEPPPEGVKPDLVPRQNASEMGLLLLLGLSVALGMAVAVGLRYLQRKHCRKRTAMSLGNQSHGNRGIIHVQECGDLVQVRRIRENSFLLVQAEYNLIASPGS